MSEKHLEKQNNRDFDELLRDALLEDLKEELEEGNKEAAGKTGEEDHAFSPEFQMEIRRLAQNGPGIFMGHCAAYALKNMKGVAKVFIYCSSEEDIKKRIVEEYGIDPQNVEATRKYYNKKRSAYFRANTGKVWDDKKNYDIVLDSGTLGIEGCVKALKGLFEE